MVREFRERQFSLLKDDLNFEQEDVKRENAEEFPDFYAFWRTKFKSGKNPVYACRKGSDYEIFYYRLPYGIMYAMRQQKGYPDLIWGCAKEDDGFLYLPKTVDELEASMSQTLNEAAVENITKGIRTLLKYLKNEQGN